MLVVKLYAWGHGGTRLVTQFISAAMCRNFLELFSGSLSSK